jgi:Mrp family chromosome partitioning ATPase
VRERTDTRVGSRKSFTDALGAEPIGELPTLALDAPWTIATDPTDPVATSLRRLRVAVWPRRGSGPARVLVTTPTGTMTTDALAANLALTSARAGWNVLLAWSALPDESLIAQGITPIDDVPDDAPLEKLLVRVPDEEGLSLITHLIPGDGIRRSTEDLTERLDELGGTFDVEILVGAPVLASPETFELCPAVDGTLVVFDVQRHSRADLARCVDALSSTGTPVLGVVAVSVPPTW